MPILGISTFYYDSVSCLFKDCEITLTTQDESVTRQKQKLRFPNNDVKNCFQRVNFLLDKVVQLVFCIKLFFKFERFLETYLGFATKSFTSFATTIILWLKSNFQKSRIKRQLNNLSNLKVNWNEKLLFFKYHLSYATSAFYPFPFQKQKKLNSIIKYRESYHQFTPSILREDISQSLKYSENDPYTIFVARLKKNMRLKMIVVQNALFGIHKFNIVSSSYPVVNDVDYSVRIQTIHEYTSYSYHLLISKLKGKIGYSLLENMTFDIRQKSIFCSPLDAFEFYIHIDIDVLAESNFLLFKEMQYPKLKKNYKDSYELE